MQSIVFIPHDAEFFAVLNNYVGTVLTERVQAYPFWNRDASLKANRKQQLNNIEYFNDDLENSWFEYFNPVKFSEDDTTHMYINNRNVTLFPFTNGKPVTNVFKLCKSNIYTSNKFSDWRKIVHIVYRNIIIPSPQIQYDIDAAIAKYIKCDKKQVVGVLCNTTDNISAYFECVDEIISYVPDATIYLATNNDFCIISFTRKYGSRVKYRQDIIRKSLYELIEGVCNTPAKGYDQLIDAYCLSSCDWFVHNEGETPLAISYMNPDLKMILIKCN